MNFFAGMLSPPRSLGVLLPQYPDPVLLAPAESGTHNKAKACAGHVTGHAVGERPSHRHRQTIVRFRPPYPDGYLITMALGNCSAACIRLGRNRLTSKRPPAALRPVGGRLRHSGLRASPGGSVSPLRCSSGLPLCEADTSQETGLRPRHDHRQP